MYIFPKIPLIFLFIFLALPKKCPLVGLKLLPIFLFNTTFGLTSCADFKTEVVLAGPSSQVTSGDVRAVEVLLWDVGTDIPLGDWGTPVLLSIFNTSFGGVTMWGVGADFNHFDLGSKGDGTGGLSRPPFDATLVFFSTVTAVMMYGVVTKLRFSLLTSDITFGNVRTDVISPYLKILLCTFICGEKERLL